MTLESKSEIYNLISFDSDLEPPELIREDVARAVLACLVFKRENIQYVLCIGGSTEPRIPDHPDTYSDPVDLA